MKPHTNNLSPSLEADQKQSIGEALGVHAVKYAQLAQDDMVYADKMNRGEVPFDQDYDQGSGFAESLSAELSDVRSFFENLGSDHQAVINKRLGKIFKSTEFEKIAIAQTSGDEKPDWVKLLGSGFSDSQLLQFLEWNVERTSNKQEVLDGAIEQQKTVFSQRVIEAVDQGWLPKGAAENLARLDDVTFLASDIFDYNLRRGELGYFVPSSEGSGVIAISTEVFTNKDLFEKVMTHEMVHAIAGVSQDGIKRGLRYGSHNAWLDEAMTEHITQSLLGNTSFDVTVPHKDKPESGELTKFGSYVEERELFTLLKSVASVRSFARVYFGTNPDHIESINRFVQDVIGSKEAYLNAMLTYECATNRKIAAKTIETLTKRVGIQLKYISSRRNAAA